MQRHQVRQGECLSSIAKRYRLPSWRTLYHHPANEPLRKKRPNPHILLPGDEVAVPASQERQEACVTTQTHTFRVSIKPVHLRVVLKDPDGQPYGDKRYVLAVAGREIEGTTAPDGLIEQLIPHHATTATLRAWVYDDDPDDPDLEYELELGQLDPSDAISGIQARLQNLGFRCAVDGILGPETLGAIARFRAAFQLSADEEPTGPMLRAKLAELHEGE